MYGTAFHKGWAADDFKEQNQYDAVWVSSPEIKRLYEKMYKFPTHIVTSPGYSRIDNLVNQSYDRTHLLDKYNIQGYEKYILIAPTWKQDDSGRSIFPYGASAKELFDIMQKVGEENNGLVIFRAHLNAGDSVKQPNYKNVRVMPHTEYPVTEEFLWIADVLVSDWSSIVFDYLPLNRPTIFFDVPPPFKHGFTLGPEYRFGHVAKSLEDFSQTLDRYIKQPGSYNTENRKKIDKTMKICYGDTADGKAAERYLLNLEKLLGMKE